MVFTLITAALIIALGGLGVAQWRLQRQAVNLQLETHKLMFPSQIRSARKVYLRGLRRQARGIRAWRIVAIVCAILAGLGLLIALGIHFQAALPDTGLDPLTQLLAWFIDGVQNAFLVPAMLLALAACGIGFYLAHWRYHTVLAADQRTQGGAQDLYWTPAPLLHRQYRLQQVQLTVLAVLSGFLLISGVADWLPTPAGNLDKVQRTTTIKRVPAAESSSAASTSSDAAISSSSRSSSSSASAATSATSSSWQQQQATEYPIDKMKKAALAPASALANLTEKDRAALLFMAYWTLNGMDTETIASMTQGKQVTYAYHPVANANGSLIVFSQTYASGGTSALTYQYYAWLNGEESYLYNMANAKGPITALATQFGITVNGSTVTPRNPNIQNSDENLRQLITAFKSYKDFQTVKKHLVRGAVVPLQ